jgi:molybdopterin converting factor subunit 1
MKITIRYFAAARDRVGGISQEEKNVDGPLSLEAFKQLLYETYPNLTTFLPRCRLAINQAFATDDALLKEGDEVAIIPPVAGGSDLVGLSDKSISAAALADKVRAAGIGAIVTFEGTVRNYARGKKVTQLHYEAFGEMAQKQLQQMAQEATQKYPGVTVALMHRTGTLEIGEVSVAIAVGSPHRGDAFEACRLVIETLKRDLTIWKRERYEGGEEWVEG